MSQQWDGIERRKSLRAGAEALVASMSPEVLRTKPTDVLLHELLVHKIELEMQNEELRRIHHELADKQERYKDLYEFAPIGLLTIDHEDRIIEINLTGAALLATERAELLKQRFSKYVAPEHIDHWYCRRINMMTVTSTEKQSLGLEMITAGGCQFHAHLDCRRQQSEETPALLLVALTDIIRKDPTDSK
jgi:PAS domain S-box-containing protein